MTKLYDQRLGRIRLRTHKLNPIIAELYIEGGSAAHSLSLEELRDLKYLIDRALSAAEYR